MKIRYKFKIDGLFYHKNYLYTDKLNNIRDYLGK